MVGLSLGRPEKGQNAVADDFINDGLIVQKNFDHFAKVAVQQLNNLLGRHSGGERGEAPQIAHEDGNLPGFASHFQGVLRFQEFFHHLFGDIAAEGVPDKIPLGNVIVEPGTEKIEGLGQIFHFLEPGRGDGHGEITLPHLLDAEVQALQGPGDGPSEPESGQDTDQRNDPGPGQGIEQNLAPNRLGIFLQAILGLPL